MVTTITSFDGTESTTPTLVLGYDAGRETGTVVHRILGGEVAVVMPFDSAPRDGTLELFYETEVDAQAGLALHAGITASGVVPILELASDDRPTLDMTYVPTGRLRIMLDPETRDRWIVYVPFQEVRV